MTTDGLGLPLDLRSMCIFRLRATPGASRCLGSMAVTSGGLTGHQCLTPWEAMSDTG